MCMQPFKLQSLVNRIFYTSLSIIVPKSEVCQDCSATIKESQFYTFSCFKMTLGTEVSPKQINTKRYLRNKSTFHNLSKFQNAALSSVYVKIMKMHETKKFKS